VHTTTLHPRVTIESQGAHEIGFLTRYPRSVGKSTHAQAIRRFLSCNSPAGVSNGQSDSGLFGLLGPWLRLDGRTKGCNDVLEPREHPETWINSEANHLK